MKHNELQIVTLKNCDPDILDHLFQKKCYYVHIMIEYDLVHVNHLLRIYELPLQVVNPYYTGYFHAYVMTRGTISIYLFIPLRMMVYTSRLKN